MLLYKYYTFVKQKLNYANNNKPFLTDSKINLSNVKSYFRICMYLLKVDLNTIYLLLAIQLDQLAMELFKDTHLVKLELLSNAITIGNALSYIRNKQQQQKGLALGFIIDQLVTIGRQTVFKFSRKVSVHHIL